MDVVQFQEKLRDICELGKQNGNMLTHEQIREETIGIHEEASEAEHDDRTYLLPFQFGFPRYFTSMTAIASVCSIYRNPPDFINILRLNTSER